MACVKDETNFVKVIFNNADVFILLAVYAFREGRKSKVLMEAFDIIWSLSDINETVKKYVEIVPSLVDAHALFGCGYVP